MTSPLAQAARIVGYVLIALVLLYDARMLSGAPGAVPDSGWVIAANTVLVLWIGEPLFRNRIAGPPSALPPPSEG